jgi:glycogen(starch) synthase
MRPVRTAFHPDYVRTVRVVMLSWEYPPFVIGGIAAHVGRPRSCDGTLGHDVVVLTLQRKEHGTSTVPDDEVVDGVRVPASRTRSCLVAGR